MLGVHGKLQAKSWFPNVSLSQFMYYTRPNPTRTSGNWLIDAAFRDRLAPIARDDISEADYHADVQAETVQALRGAGNIVEENIRLSRNVSDGTIWNYDADAIMKPSCDDTCNVVEVKTSTKKLSYDEFNGSEFRRKQFPVLVAANVGDNVYSKNNRIARLSLPVNQTLPQMGVLLMYAIPGQLLRPKYVAPGSFSDLLSLAE